jgi:hypothetical protein
MVILDGDVLCIGPLPQRPPFLLELSSTFFGISSEYEDFTKLKQIFLEAKFSLVLLLSEFIIKEGSSKDLDNVPASNVRGELGS